jgi:DNA-binding CsgD family transcriptional regulator
MIERIARDLATVTLASSDRLREHAVRALRRAVGADGGIFYHVHPSERGLVFGAIHTDVGEVASTTGTAVLPSPTLRITAPKPEEHNAFSPGVDRWVRPKHRDPLVERVYGPLAVYDDLRMLAYDGPRFVGWIGTVRRGRGRHYDRIDARRLAPLVGPLVRVLSFAVELDGAQEEAMYLVMDARGQVQHATPEAAAWLSTERLAVLRSWIGKLDASSSDASWTLQSTRLHAMRLDGPGGVAYLVSLRGAPAPSRIGLEALTNAQREVAFLAAGGATAEDIGRALERSPGTVRVHLKAIYKRLGINSRAELAREVDDWRRRVKSPR